jgi:hypothetical protein
LVLRVGQVAAQAVRQDSMKYLVVASVIGNVVIKKMKVAQKDMTDEKWKMEAKAF